MDHIRAKLEEERHTAAELREKSRADEALLIAKSEALEAARREAKESIRIIQDDHQATIKAQAEEAQKTQDRLKAELAQQQESHAESLEIAHQLGLEKDKARREANEASMLMIRSEA